MHKLFHQLVVSLKYIRLVQKRHLARAITGDHVTELDEKTLTGRLLHYLERNNVSNSVKTRDILGLLKQNDVNNLAICKTPQILSAFNVISKKKYQNSNEILTLLDLLDHELCRRLNELKITEILNVLHTYMNILPQRIIEYNVYKNSMEKLFNECDNLSKSDLIQFIFYLGLPKKTTRSQYMLKKCMNILTEDIINDLNTEDLCVICNSTFKTSTKINNKLFLNRIVSYLNDNLCILNDPALFITLIKTIRHNRYQNEELLGTLNHTMFFNKTIKYYSFSALCHILALYSDYLYYDNTLMKVFTERCIEVLRHSNYTTKHAYLQDQPRVKDIKRFLWCLSNLNYSDLDIKDIKDVIIPNIMKRIEGNEFKDDLESLVEMILYLWMLNYQDQDIIAYTLTQHNVLYIRASASPTKQRLNLLLTCLYYEDRKLYKPINIQPQTNIGYSPNVQLNKRILLQRVYKILNTIPTKYEINKYTLDCQVPHLNIVGITGYKKKIYKAVHIEILDDYTCMKNTDGLPSGLMQLKLRIMEQFDEGIIMIRASEVESMSDDELSNLLEDELELVC